MREALPYQIISLSAQPVTEWAGGRTRQLAIYPATATLAAQDFAWRLSAASVELAGRFSRFAGFQRILGLRQGAGLQLQIAAQQLQLHASAQMLYFSGEADTSAELLAGPICDINLIYRPDWQAQLQPLQAAVPPIQPQQLKPAWQQLYYPAAATQLLLYADQAQLTVRTADWQVQLQRGDLLLWQAPVHVATDIEVNLSSSAEEGVVQTNAAVAVLLDTSLASSDVAPQDMPKAIFGWLQAPAQ